MNFEKMNIGRPAPTETEKDTNLDVKRFQRNEPLQWLHDNNLTKYLACALAIAPVFKHSPAQAAEIPPGADFYIGVTALKDEAMNGPNEVGATFIIREGAEQGEWPHKKTGDVTQVVTNLGEVTDAVLNSLGNNGNGYKGTIKLRVCRLHTHPVTGGVQVGYITQEHADAIRSGEYTVSMPPSGTDVSILSAAQLKALFEDELEKSGIYVETINGVVDPAGIIYHRIITDEDRTKHFPEYDAELQERRELINSWSKAVKDFLSSADDDVIDKMHALTKHKGEYDTDDFYATNFDAKTLRGFKEGDIYIKLLTDSKDGDELTRLLVSVNPKIKELQKQINATTAADKKHNDDFSKALQTWAETSMTIGMDAESLRHSQAYRDMQEAYARAGAIIRFVGHDEVENEPPCAGVDYK